jgi:TrmH family RNA methyltransferase
MDPMSPLPGGEAQDASLQACKRVNQKISIPMPGGAESLNAAVAGSILIYEILR